MTSQDALIMDTYHGQRRITLETFGDRFSQKPTDARWQSFTWKVVPASRK
jgi:hypothetical protein